MIRIQFALCVLLPCMLVGAADRQYEADSSATHAKKRTRVPEYFHANHGFDGGLHKMIDLRELEGFDDIRTIAELAQFASKVPGAMGFAVHPHFESGQRYARAVLWYTKLSPKTLSWPLYLFDRNEAQKNPGDSPQTAALEAAESAVAGRINEARDLIDTGGPNGVELIGDPDEKKVLAHAVMRLGGTFEHTGQFASGRCGGCRVVVSGGDPLLCGLGIQKEKHWTCCASTILVSQCQYWKLTKAQDDIK